MKRRSVTIKTDKPPIVELDSEAHAAYVRFSTRKVAETRPVSTDGCIITIDLDSDGGIIGVELIGVHEFGVELLLEKAGIPPIPKRLSERVRYVPANLQVA
jgi:uncharacterized protein YuzE